MHTHKWSSDVGEDFLVELAQPLVKLVVRSRSGWKNDAEETRLIVGRSGFLHDGCAASHSYAVPDALQAQQPCSRRGGAVAGHWAVLGFGVAPGAD